MAIKLHDNARGRTAGVKTNGARDFQEAEEAQERQKICEAKEGSREETREDSTDDGPQ